MKPRRPVVEIIDPMMVEILQTKTPKQRLTQAFSMWDSAVTTPAMNNWTLDLLATPRNQPKQRTTTFI